MSASTAFDNSWLKHILQNVAIAGIGDATGLPASATAGNLYCALHTADPGADGNQSTSEANYTGYARVAIARVSGSWTVTGGSFSNAAIVGFGKCTAGSNTVTHFSVGYAASGAGTIIRSAPLTTPLTISSPITPSFAVGDWTGSAS